MPEPSSEPTLYLFDGHNLLHAAGLAEPQELVDRLAGFVALHGARGIVVFDGVGDDAAFGALEVRFAPDADPLLERLAAEHRARERICLVSTDRDLRSTAGQEVRKLSSEGVLGELVGSGSAPEHVAGSKIEDAIEEKTRIRLEEWRRRRT